MIRIEILPKDQQRKSPETSEDPEMLLLIVFLLRLADTEAVLFPAVCFENGTNRAGCCPLFKDSPCGEKYGRGSCETLGSPNPNMDIRYEFPNWHMLTRCNCREHFIGANCGGCMFNFKGDNCEQITTLQRRDCREMSEVEREEFKAQLQYCKDLRDPEYLILKAGDISRRDTYVLVPGTYYEVWSHWDFYASRPFLQNGREDPSIQYTDGGPCFFTRNRLSINFLEWQMRRCLGDYSFCLPYYDYQNDESCDLCSNEFMGWTDEDGSISEYSFISTWRGICSGFVYDDSSCLMSDCPCEREKITRRLGLTPGITKPTTTDLKNCMGGQKQLDESPYTSDSTGGFRACIEEMHQRWLAYIGGTMSVRAFAANDPLYALTMVFMDKVFDRGISFSIMQNRSWTFPDNTNYGQRPSDCIMPCLKCYTHQSMVTEMRNLGVLYSSYNGM